MIVFSILALSCVQQTCLPRHQHAFVAVIVVIVVVVVVIVVVVTKRLQRYVIAFWDISCSTYMSTETST